MSRSLPNDTKHIYFSSCTGCREEVDSTNLRYCIMSKDELIDSHVSLKQCRQAVEALHSHELKKKEKFEETQLLPGKDQHIWLNVTVKQIPAGHKLKPVKMYVSSML